MSDPPTINSTELVPNGETLWDVLVYLTAPANLGSGTALPYATSGTIVNYTVTMQIASGADPAVTVEGLGTPQADGTIQLVFTEQAIQLDQDYTVSATATNEFGVSGPSNDWFFGPSRSGWPAAFWVCPCWTLSCSTRAWPC